MTCPSLETAAAWVLGEQTEEESDRFEEHLFACDRCAARTLRMEALVGQLRAALPPLLTGERRRRLEATGQPMPVVHASPGVPATIEFGKGAAVGFWVLRADLSRVERLDCELLGPGGEPLVSIPDVPFDADRGEVVLACQRHYQHLGFPDEMQVRLTSVESAGSRPVGEYWLNHLFHPM